MDPSYYGRDMIISHLCRAEIINNNNNNNFIETRLQDTIDKQ